ncbi:MAG TPA: hypothetical protein VFQ35_15195 [Polyangiaceae bacterium]|nr:hypothetical protein [Polyangiaceae bacterium]
MLALVTSALLVAPSVVAEPLAAPKRAVRSAGVDEPNVPNVTFTGFRRLSDGRALLYVELSAKVPVSVLRQQGAVIYRLEGARVALKNNKNPLLTGAFATNLLSARLVTPKPARKGKGRAKEPSTRYVDVVLNLRAGVTPTHVMSDRPGGAVLEITIPAAGGK